MSIPWHGELPKRWEVHKTSELFAERREKVSDTDFAPLSVSKGGVVPQIATVAKSNTGDNRKLVKKGDFAINSRSDRRGSSGVSDYGGSVSLINIVLTPRSETNGKYWHYLLKSYNFIEEYYRNGRGIVADLWTTRLSEMKTIYLPLPPREEQDQIVRYLDWKMSQINKLINAKRRQIALLGEMKQTIITRAVIGGLKRNVKTKSSGIIGLASIPEHWNTLRLGQALCNIEQGWSPQASKRTESKQWSVVALSCINRGLFTPTEIKPIDKPQQKSLEFIQLYEGDLLMTRSNARERVGDVAIVRNPLPRTIFSDLIYRLTPTSTINVGFLAACLLSRVGRNQIEIFARGSSGTMPKITQGHIKSLTVPLPPKNEQEEIVTYLDKQYASIDKLINKLNDEIALFAEYRTRLISDVVTGKVDVRGVAVPEFETVENVVVSDDEGENELMESVE